MTNKYERTAGSRLGPGLKDDKEISVLNRIVRWTPNGIQYEADPRQVEKLLREIELEGANASANCAVWSVTPYGCNSGFGGASFAC